MDPPADHSVTHRVIDYDRRLGAAEKNDDDATIAETPRAATTRKLSVQMPGRYRVLEILGEGGMGRVYRAHDTTLGRDVAIKMIEKDLPGPDKTMQRERFVREARAAARLLHPNIAVVHDVDPDAGWLVMELVIGESLRDLAALEPLSPALVRDIATQVLAALGAAHAAGIIHRDVKPSNIVRTAAGNVKLVDFGVARLLDAEMTRTGDQVGTPAYMAPEQIRGAAVDARTDLYGLGATLYELVTGTRMIAFESPSASALAKVRDACASEPGLGAMIVRCLQADPDARFASAADAVAALGATPKRRVRWIIPIASLVVLAVAGGAVWWLRHRATPRDPRVVQAFTLAQRGEADKATDLLNDYLTEHPDDGDALILDLLAEWWRTGAIDATLARTAKVPLRPAQRALAKGIDLIVQRREPEAIAFLESADREHPDQVEILYALGEARWHGQHLEDGVATLERAFLIDPRWQVALHHVIEFRLSRGDANRLVAIADKLRVVDAASAASLDCQISIGQRDYAGAVASARAALGRVEKTAELYICLAQAQALTGDLDGGMATAKQAFDLWPIDMREFGGFAQYAEFFLYRGKLDEYLDLVRDKPSNQRTLARMMWKPGTGYNAVQPSGPGMRMNPFGAALWILFELQHGRDAVAVYGSYPEPEVKAYGESLWAENRGDLAAAIAGYRKALSVPAKGDMRMLLAHHLARVLYATGDTDGAAAICHDEVIAPRLYEGYRAVLLPDCLLWTHAWKQLVDSWQGSFEHPAVVEARRRLAQ